MKRMLQKAVFALTLLLIGSCSGTTQITVSPISSTEKPQVLTPTDTSYIDLQYPPLPSSIRTSTSWQKAIWIPSAPISWGIDTVMDEKNIMLWFTKIIRYDEAGHPIFQVKDVVILPPSAREKDVVVSECILASQPDFEIVALVNVDQESLQNRWLPNSHIVSAWRANQSKGKLEEISTEKVECNAETFLTFP